MIDFNQIHAPNFSSQIAKFFNTYRYNTLELFSDYINHQVMSLRTQVEGRLDLASSIQLIEKKYDAAYIQAFPLITKKLGEVMMTQISDYLGEIYMSLSINNKYLGQVFTPFHIAEFIAQTTFSDLGEQRKIPQTVLDPCCGSGSLLLGAVKCYQRADLNYLHELYITAQDIDPLAAAMCYLQLSSAGANAVIYVGNSLLNEVRDVLPTLGYVLMRSVNAFKACELKPLTPQKELVPQKFLSLSELLELETDSCYEVTEKNGDWLASRYRWYSVRHKSTGEIFNAYIYANL